MRKANRKLARKRSAEFAPSLGHAVRNDKDVQLAANALLAGLLKQREPASPDLVEAKPGLFQRVKNWFKGN